MRMLLSHECGPGLIMAWRHMWVEFFVGFRLAPRVFL